MLVHTSCPRTQHASGGLKQGVTARMPILTRTNSLKAGRGAAQRVCGNVRACSHEYATVAYTYSDKKKGELVSLPEWLQRESSW